MIALVSVYPPKIPYSSTITFALPSSTLPRNIFHTGSASALDPIDNNISFSPRISVLKLLLLLCDRLVT